MTLKPFWATSAVRLSSSDHGSLQRREDKEKWALEGAVGQGGGSKHRAQLCSQGLLEYQAVGPAVAKRSTELSVLVFFLNEIISVLQDGHQRGMAVHGGGKGHLSSKISSQALVLSKSFKSLHIPTEHQGQAHLL